MPKVLAQAGDSLADVYDVVGSVAGVEELVSSDVHLSHEMGSAIFSERMGGAITPIATGNVAQSTTFDITIAIEPPGPARILGAMVVANAGGRVSIAALSVATIDPGIEQDFPFWAWQSTVAGDVERSVRMQIQGAAVANSIQLQPGPGVQTPLMLIGRTQRNPVPTLRLRGSTLAFGAGTVRIEAFVYFALAFDQAVSSRGLPIPSW